MYFTNRNLLVFDFDQLNFVIYNESSSLKFREVTILELSLLRAKVFGFIRTTLRGVLLPHVGN